MDNAATKKRLGTTGKDPQRKRTSSNEKEGEAIKRKDLLKEEDNAATEKKRLGTTGKDPQRKRTSANKKEGEAIKRKDLLKEEDNAATKKKIWNDRERPTTKTKKKRELERQGKIHNENARV